MTAIPVAQLLRCDGDGCDEAIRFDYTVEPLSRVPGQLGIDAALHATTQGWAYEFHKHYCPEHAQERERKREARAATRPEANMLDLETQQDEGENA